MYGSILPELRTPLSTRRLFGRMSEPAGEPSESGDATVPAATAPPATPDATASRLARLLEALEEEERVLVLTHDNPDPDALASAAGLAFLLEQRASVSTTIAFGGIVGRAENRALMQELSVKFQRIESLDPAPGTAVALVDTQPRAGNNSLPAGRIASVVVDHHPARPDSTAATFSDIRPEYGASCSMLVEYLRAADLEPERRLATALFYGIQSETMDLGREASLADIEASTYLYPLSDPAAISRIRHARVPASYFRSMHDAYAVARRYGNVVVVPMRRLDYPDMVAEIADLFMQMVGIDWTISMGRFRDHLLLSMRTYDTQAHAGTLVREAIGERGSAGGHGTFAGGQVSIRALSDEEAEALGEEILADLLAALGADDESPQPLIADPDRGPAEASE
jgi:nanoRNase/pAp phosphatase (c-di-AMP/oligoRNAs hydrolase)